MNAGTELDQGQNAVLSSRRLRVDLGRDTGGLDIIVLLVDESGKVGHDLDLVFFNAPVHPTGAVEVLRDSAGIWLDRVPPTTHRVVLAAHAESGEGLSELVVSLSGESDAWTFRPTAVDDLPTAVLAEVYRRGDTWKVRAVGQGWESGLSGLVTEFGVHVDAEHPQGDIGGHGDPAHGQRGALEGELEDLQRQIADARAHLVETDERRLLQQVGFYQFRHPLDDVLSSKTRLDELRQKIKRANSSRSAVHGKSEWMVNGSLKEGRALVREFGDLMLRTYNIEADNCVRTVRAHSVDSVAQRLERTRQAIASSGRTMGVSIDTHYHQLRVDELKLVADHHLRVEQDKEAAREERQRQREEVKAQDELRRQKKHLLKEQAHYKTLLELSRTSGDEHAAEVARERLAELAESLDDVNEMAANTRVGYVYVISNIGAFGDRVVKIGMTRREDPRLRVSELSSASVPFKFDVHALIFSHDAVALEAALHQCFDPHRVNRVNRRREFFLVSPEDVRTALRSVGGNHVIEFTEVPEASEWRQSRPSGVGASGVHLSRHGS